MRENRDAHVGHGDDIGRRSGRLLARLLDRSERSVVVGNHDAGAEGTHDEEETETPVDGLEGVLDVDARALGFSCHHGDVLGSDDTESGCENSKISKNGPNHSQTTEEGSPLHMQAKNPSKRPREPLERYSAKAPGLFQCLNP